MTIRPNKNRSIGLKIDMNNKLYYYKQIAMAGIFSTKTCVMKFEPYNRNPRRHK
jgi:hypothetical protein